MKLKNKNELIEQEIKTVFDEELKLVIEEEIRAGRIDENFLKHMKNAGKGLFDYYKIMMTNYAKMLDNMVNQELIPSALGQKIEDKLDDLDSPQEFKGDDPAAQADAVGDLEDLMRATADAAEESGSTQAATKVDDMADAAAAVEDAVEDEASDAGDSGDVDASTDPSEEKVKAAVLDLLDATSEKWDNIMKTTNDANLKKSMEYMEKVALAERLISEIRKQIREMSGQNKKKRLITKKLRGK